MLLRTAVVIFLVSTLSLFGCGKDKERAGNSSEGVTTVINQNGDPVDPVNITNPPVVDDSKLRENCANRGGSIKDLNGVKYCEYRLFNYQVNRCVGYGNIYSDGYTPMSLGGYGSVRRGDRVQISSSDSRVFAMVGGVEYPAGKQIDFTANEDGWLAIYYRVKSGWFKGDTACLYWVRALRCEDFQGNYYYCEQ